MLVVATSDLEKVALEFITEGVTGDLYPTISRLHILTLTHPSRRIRRRNKVEEIREADFGAHALLHERTELALIIDLDDFLRPIGRVGNVELHLDGSSAVKTNRDARVLSTGRGIGVVRLSSFRG